MIEIFENTSGSVPIKFRVSGVAVTPDDGEAYFSLYDRNLNVILDMHNVHRTGISGSETWFEIDSQYNNLEDGLVTSNFYLNVFFKVGGFSHNIRVPYRVIKNIPMTVEPSDVRSLLGVDSDELPDSDIDIFSSYLMIHNEYGQRFDDSLTIGGNRSYLANKAISLLTAIELIPSLEMRVLQDAEVEGGSFRRFSDFDVEELRERLSQAYAQSISFALGESDEVVSDYLLLTTPTNIFPGA